MTRQEKFDLGLYLTIVGEDRVGYITVHTIYSSSGNFLHELRFDSRQGANRFQNSGNPFGAFASPIFTERCLAYDAYVIASNPNIYGETKTWKCPYKDSYIAREDRIRFTDKKPILRVVEKCSNIGIYLIVDQNNKEFSSSTDMDEAIRYCSVRQKQLDNYWQRTHNGNTDEEHEKQQLIDAKNLREQAEKSRREQELLDKEKDNQNSIAILMADAMLSED